jgi:LysM repeat protein
MNSNPSPSTKICPTCGSKLAENSTRCVVCGRIINPTGKGAEVKAVKSPRLPELTLNLPIAIGLLVVILLIGAALTWIVLRTTGRVSQPEQTPTPTTTATITPTATEEPTSTPQPTPTPMPPIEYTIKEGDYCSSIAYIYNVSIESLTELNRNLNCNLLVVGDVILVPVPTLTPTPAATGTLSSAQATEQACLTDTYTVQAGDTLMGIANAYNVDMASIRDWNGLPSDNVWTGEKLLIPLCERRPTEGPTPTATTPPPYPAPNLLLPVDGASFTAANDSITLQWASVGTLRSNEAYQVTIEDLTEGSSKKLVVYVTDTSYILTASFRPVDTSPHAIRWSVQPVRQTGTDSQGKPIWSSQGAVSNPRVFIWSGLGGVTPTP